LNAAPRSAPASKQSNGQIYKSDATSGKQNDRINTNPPNKTEIRRRNKGSSLPANATATSAATEYSEGESAA